MLLALAAIAMICGTATPAADDAPPSAPELAKIFRTLLLPNLPAPLVQQSINWDHQKDVIVGLKWETSGILLKPELQKKPHNDGIWRRLAVTADDPEKTLALTVRNVKNPEPGRLTFSIQLELPVHLKFEQQLWRAGTRIYSGETRARCKVFLALDCESTSRLETKPDSFFPELIMRMRATGAKLNYDDFRVEHTAGVGGDIAKILGDAVHETIKTLKPSLETNLRAKANSAIVKAADTKEVRLGLGKLFETKK